MSFFCTFYSILFYSILLDYQSLYGHGKEDEPGYLRGICWAVMLVPYPRTTYMYYIDPDRTSREQGQGNLLVHRLSTSMR